VYKEAISIDKTVSIMKEAKGTHFDPHLLDLFTDNLDHFLEIQKNFPDDENAHSILDLLGEN
jgi:putative two-component system response regulator